VQIEAGKELVSSFPFRIGGDLVFRETAEAAASFYFWQRCGFAVPGIHEACHLDDARIPDQLGGGHRNVTGGWHDAGDYAKYNGYTPHSVYALVSLARMPDSPLSLAARKQVLDERSGALNSYSRCGSPEKASCTAMSAAPSTGTATGDSRKRTRTMSGATAMTA